MTESERGHVDDAPARQIPMVRCACGYIAVGRELAAFCPACDTGRPTPVAAELSGDQTPSVVASLLLSTVVYLFPIIGPHFVLPLGAFLFLGVGGFPLFLLCAGMQLSLALAISWVLSGKWLVRGLVLVVYVPVLWAAMLALLELAVLSSTR